MFGAGNYAGAMTHNAMHCHMSSIILRSKMPAIQTTLSALIYTLGETRTVCGYNSRRPWKAWDRVPPSTYSSSPPSGTPWAIRVTLIPRLCTISLM